jgi:hypothetical protein
MWNPNPERAILNSTQSNFGSVVQASSFNFSRGEASGRFVCFKKSVKFVLKDFDMAAIYR